MNVLSLFDGMSCGREALERCGFWVDNYYASEIDKYAMQIAKKNYPDTIHIGDVMQVKVSNLPAIDILIGGSPCQGFSFAGKQLNFEDPRSKLFFEFVRLLKECKPKYFFLENVKMKKEHQDVISSYLGVEPIDLNSALVSAQNRKRLYWTNIQGYEAPKDKGLLLKSILQNKVSREFEHSEKAVAYMLREVSGGRNHFDFKHHHDTGEGKSSCLTANMHKGVPYNVLLDRRPRENVFQINPSKKAGGKQPHIQDRIYHINGKCVALTAAYARIINIGSTEPYYIRKLTPIECERLQTLPDNYTAGVSNSQRYKMLGNGWTVDAICEFFKHIPKDLELL